MKFTELLKLGRKDIQPLVAIRQQDYLKLFQLMRAHHLLQLTVRGDTKRYQTMLLEVNADEGYIVVDEPFPQEGVLSGAFKQHVTLEHEHDGFSTVISTVVEMRIQEDGDTYYRLAWPEKVEEIQRRDQFRLGMADSWVSDVAISGLDGHVVSAVMDLSANGMRIAFEGNQVESIYAGSYFPQLRLKLAGCDPIDCSFDITHCHYVPDADLNGVQMTVAGGRLVGLSHQERQAIQRFIFSAQRYQRRDQLEQEVAA